ncbi:MAG: hypothetical protein MUE85_07650 [Microscillaceae bacterium]|jgi:hypothetical protein|nr:hypothetical protein [Microscillaceae bacterium]
MKLLHTLLLAGSFGLLTACGGGTTETKSTDTTKTEAKEETTEVKEEAKEEVKFELTDDVKPFVNKWKLAEVTHTDGKTEKAKEDGYLELKEDGTFNELFGKNVVASGNWTASKDKKTLTLIHKSGDYKSRMGKEEEPFVIKEISADKLATVDADGKMTEIFVAEKK